MGFTASNAITMGGVQVWDEGTRKTYGRGRDGTAFTRHLRCAWGDERALVQHLQSGSQQIGNVTVVTAAQRYPGYNNIYVDTIEVEGEGPLGNDVALNVAAYQWAVLNVRYTPMDFSAGHTEIDFGKEIISLPENALMFDGGGAVGQGASFPVAVVTIRQSKFSLPLLPVSTILNATAKPVNTSPIFGAPAGTVLFDGGRSLARYNLTSGTQYDVNYSFVYRSVGWGKLFDRVTKTWRKVHTTDNKPMLDSSDLNALFA